MKNKKTWYRIFSAFLITILLTGTISTGAISTSAATVNTQISVEDVEITDEDVEMLAKALELIFESGQITEGNEIIGYNKKCSKKSCKGMKIIRK